MNCDVSCEMDINPTNGTLPVGVPNLLEKEARGFYQIFNIRVYAKELTEEERYYNYKIDETRI